MKHIPTFLAAGLIAAASLAAVPAFADGNSAPDGANPLELAQRFSGGKLKNMLFSTTVSPHWFQSGDKFWYSYKTADGTKWYVVNPTAGSKSLLFDNDKLAAELTLIMHDPINAADLPIRKLEVQPDGHTFTFEVTSSQDAKPDRKSVV